MKFIKHLFNEHANDVSMMRLMSFMSLCVAAYLAITHNNESVHTFVYAAFGGKAVQKYLENQETPKAPQP